MPRDKNFDELAHRFERNVYSSVKGQIRLSVLWNELVSHCQLLQEGGKAGTILDAGGGLGQIGLKLAEQGHHIVYCDISLKMLERARQQAEDRGLAQQFEFIHGPVQAMEETGKFDLVLFHAVMEWLSEPFAVLETVTHLVKPGGYISLMFYNLHSLIIRNLIRGNLRKIKEEKFAGDENSLTPPNPLYPDAVLERLGTMGVNIVSECGVRVFFDYMQKELQQSRTVDDLLEMEMRYCSREPYRSMGRYYHVCARKAD